MSFTIAPGEAWGVLGTSGSGKTTLLLASHELPSVQVLCDQLLLLHDGQTLCQGSAANLFSDPLEPHLRELMEATPRCLLLR